MKFVRLGPDRLATGLAPGGVVFRCYTVDDGRLVFEDRVVPPRCTPAAEHLEAMLSQGCSTVLVAYDGDTGNRATPADYEIAGINVEPLM